MAPHRVVGRDPRVPPHRTRPFIGGLLLAAVLVACGSTAPDGSARPGSSGDPGVTGPEGSGAAAAGGGTTSGFSLDRVAGIDLEVSPLTVPESLDLDGGPQLAAMLEALGLGPSQVGLTVAVDPAGRLAIGHWQLPGASADAILDAWAGASGWAETTLGGRPGLSGTGPDGGSAWASAADGVFLYISADDRSLADAAAAALVGA